MSDKIEYSVLGIHGERIQELVAGGKYKNTDDFIKSAIEILLTWESEHPEECIELMKSLMPFSPQQESFMKMTMNPDELKKQFGVLEIERDEKELTLQKDLSLRNDDHLKLRDNYQHAKKYISSLKIKKLKNEITYDGYPLLFSFYSRLLPVKIVITTLGHMLERNKSEKIELKDLRVNAYDIAEEISETLSKYEKNHHIARNRKMSTGLPKKGKDENDDEKIAMAQKRFKDQFVGRVRKNRITGTEYVEGAPAALGLICAAKENDEFFVSLTDKGKKFFLLENPVMQGEYERGPLTKEEGDFILNELIPDLKLENEFVNIALDTIKKHGKKTDKKITSLLDEKFYEVAKKFNKSNPEIVELYNLNNLDSFEDDATKRKITSWRVATMGRLAEMNRVEWTIDRQGDSVFTIVQ